jgi:Cu-Zn family superoxide dismutase
MTGTETMAGTAQITDTGTMTGTGTMTETTAMTDTISGLSNVRTATATLKNVEGEVIGSALFTQVDSDPVEIEVTIDQAEALNPSAHGIHIHTIAACTPDFEAAGGHFNPANAQHGLENPDGSHAGDLPNLEVSADGTSYYTVQTDRITLGDGMTSLFDTDGSALMIHADADNQTTDPAGDSGERVACGIIEPGTNSAADARD